MVSEFIKPDDTRWRVCLKELEHDIYHLPEYSRFVSQFESGTPLAFYAEDENGKCLVPLVVRPLPEQLHQPDAWCDATSPYGYPAPIFSTGLRGERVKLFMRSFVETARNNNIISVFLRLNPLLEAPLGALQPFGEIVMHGPTVYFDLKKSEADIWHETRGGHRRHINKLKRLGFHAVVDDWQYFDSFKEIYRATMQRVDATSYYFFNDAYFDRMCESLQHHLHLITVLSPAGDICCSGLFMSNDTIAQYHLSGTSESYVRESPTKLMIDEARRWAAGQGRRYLHLGGGVGAHNDNLFLFKKGFSQTLSNFYTLRIIIDLERYDQCAKAANLENRSLLDPDFFPLYRYS